MRLPATACLFLLSVSSAFGGTGQFTVLGVGSASCGNWTQSRALERTVRAISPNLPTTNAEGWLLGFITGVGWVGPTDPGAYTDAVGVAGWVDNYCQAHPTDQIVDAAKAFLKFVQANPRHP